MSYFLLLLLRNCLLPREQRESLLFRMWAAENEEISCRRCNKQRTPRQTRTKGKKYDAAERGLPLALWEATVIFFALLFFPEQLPQKDCWPNEPTTALLFLSLFPGGHLSQSQLLLALFCWGDDGRVLIEDGGRDGHFGEQVVGALSICLSALGKKNRIATNWYPDH